VLADSTACSYSLEAMPAAANTFGSKNVAIVARKKAAR
jgi:hypothetical protein